MNNSDKKKIDVGGKKKVISPSPIYNYVQPKITFEYI